MKPKPKRKPAQRRAAGGTPPLYRAVRSVLETARRGAWAAVNSAMVQAYWHVGRLIVEHEQRGARRAVYGAAVLDDLSRRLTAEFGRGYTATNLRYMRQFFLAFPIHHALRDESRASVRGLPEPGATTGRAASDEACDLATAETGSLRPELTWTHYRMLLRVDDEEARHWYLREAADEHWSTRQLDRQISVL